MTVSTYGEAEGAALSLGRIAPPRSRQLRHVASQAAKVHRLAFSFGRRTREQQKTFDGLTAVEGGLRDDRARLAHLIWIEWLLTQCPLCQLAITRYEHQ